MVVPVERAAGHILAQDLRDPQGRVLLAAGVAITPRYAERLRSLGWLEVPIQGPRLGEDAGSAAVEGETAQRAVLALHKAFTSYRNERWLNTAALRSVVDRIIAELRRSGPVLHHLEILHSYDNQVFHHSTNVSAVSTLVGMAHGIASRDLPVLGLAGLLHDVGKIKVPSALLNKLEPLTPEETQILRRHSEWGAEIAQEAKLDQRVVDCILQHHERLDGSGYPRGLAGSQIGLLARTVGVADAFCAMAADHLYRRRVSPREAVDTIRTDGGYDREVLQALLRSVALYPNGTFVRVTGWRLAVVLRQTRDPFLPMLRLLTDADGTALHGKPVRLTPDLPGGPNAILDLVPPEEALEVLPPQLRG